MREIKFRAWDKHEKKMIFDGYYGSGIFIDLEGTIQWDEVPTERIVLMQFTGLLDKNGKEIYEGDILEYFKKYFPVVFEDTWISPFKAGDNCGCCESGSIPSEYEVVGNIYENPKLLK